MNLEAIIHYELKTCSFRRQSVNLYRSYQSKKPYHYHALIYIWLHTIQERPNFTKTSAAFEKNTHYKVVKVAMLKASFSDLILHLSSIDKQANQHESKLQGLLVVEAQTRTKVKYENYLLVG